MASIAPEILVAGTVREVTRKEFYNRQNGEVEFKGHTVTVLTRAGFFQFTVPTGAGNPADLFPVGAPAVAWITARQWQYAGREGTSYVFARPASPHVAEAILAEALATVSE